MPRKCSICTHPERASIEVELTKGTSYRCIARDFQLGVHSVERHAKTHFAEVISQAKQEIVTQSVKRVRPLLELIVDGF